MDLSNASWTKVQGIKINECLSKILSSPMFTKAERQQRFLSYILRETLDGRAEKLKGYTIGIEVFDRDSSFDPAESTLQTSIQVIKIVLLDHWD